MTEFPPIEELLLHRDIMLLLEEVLTFSEETVTCLSTPDATAWYAAEGAMPAWIGIELMAQAIAAHVTLLARREGKEPRPGALLGTRDYRSTVVAFPAGKALAIQARQTFRNGDGLASYECAILAEDGEKLAMAALTVYEPQDFERFISGTED